MIGLIIFLGFFCTDLAQAQLERIDPDAVKIYLVTAVSHVQSLEASRLEVWALNEDKSTLVQKAPLNEVKLNGTLVLEPGSLGSRTVSIQVGEAKHLLATQEIQENWFPKVEICQSQSAAYGCRYSVYRDPENNTLTLNVFEK